MSQRLLALDQASKITGWSFFVDGKLTKWGKFEATQDDIGDRLHFIRQQVIKLIEENDVNEVAFEDIQFQDRVQNNVQTFKVLAEVFGIIYELCKDLQLPTYIVPSVTWKSALNIKGTKRPEQKRNAQQYVLDHYNLKVTQDESDSICLGTSVCLRDTEKPSDGFHWAL